MKNNKKLSIVIPVYNGSKSIFKLVDLLISSINSTEIQTEIVLVNDCSTDNSEEICSKIFQKYPTQVRFYSLAKNVGEHNTVMAGLNMCSGDWAIIMDDDFQNPISEVIKLMDFTIQNDFDVVYTYYGKKQHNFFRNIGSKFNGLFANILLSKPKDLYLSSFKSISRFLIDEIIKYDLPYPYIDGLILRTTSNIGKVKVAHIKRELGESGYTLKKLISLWLQMFTNFSVVPLRLATLSGILVALFGFILGIYTVYEKMINPELPRGYAILFIALCLFSGIILISIGLIGEYVGRIFISLNKKPQFTIKKKMIGVK